MKSLVHVTDHDTGKLEGIPSINFPTSDFCRTMRKVPGTICASCYDAKMSKARPSIQRALERNRFLSERPIADHEVPRFVPGSSVRFNSFGELDSLQHLKNIYTIANKNPQVYFALWTKRADIMDKARPIPIPKNIVIIKSSLMLDDNPPSTIPSWADYIYIVRTTGEPCGNKCMDCMKCYRRPSGQEIIYQLKH